MNNVNAWRTAAASRPGYATYPNTAPGNPTWWRRPARQSPDDGSATAGPNRVTLPAAEHPSALAVPRPAVSYAAALTEHFGEPMVQALNAARQRDTTPPRRQWWTRWCPPWARPR